MRGGTIGSRARWVGAMLATSALMTGCSTLGAGSAPGDRTNTPSTAPSTTAGPKAEFARPDHKLLSGRRATLTAGDLTVTTLLADRSMPGLTFALDVVRGQILRHHAWAGGGELTMEPTLLASSSKAVAVALNVEGKGGKRTSVVYYDPQSNESFASPALISPQKWAEFTAAVGAKAGEEKAAALKALASPTWPMGQGPALAFSQEGNLVIQFQGGSQPNVLLTGKEAGPFLTDFGRRAKAAAQYPTRAEAAQTFAPASPDLVARPKGKQKDPRPQLALGTDCTVKKCVALTFDDGPVPETQEVLDALNKARVPATFFMLGPSIDAYPEMVTKASANGMEIASHNLKHNTMSTAGNEALAHQISTNSKNLEKLAGTAPLFLRPPYGDRSKRVDAEIGRNSMAVALWSVDTLDWKFKTTPSILSYVGQQTTNGAVVLMHDIHATSRAAVPAVIAKLKADGYTMTTLAEMAPSDYRFGAPFCSSPALPHSCVR